MTNKKYQAERQVSCQAGFVRVWRTSLLACATLILFSQNGMAQSQAGRNVTKSFTEPIEQSLVAAAQSGVVMKVEAKEGDRVQAGDTLATLNHNVLLEARAIALAKAMATARLDAARSKFELFKVQKETMEPLIEEGHINQYEFDMKLTEFENALAEFKSVKDDLEFAKLEVRKIDAEIGERVIKSPINGFVTVIHKRLGEHVSATDPQYATVVRLDQLKIRFYLNRDNIGDLQIGSTVEVLVGRETRPRKANVIFVSPVIDPDSGLARIEVLLDNSNLALRSGVICYLQKGRGTSPAQAKATSDSRLKR